MRPGQQARKGDAKVKGPDPVCLCVIQGGQSPTARSVAAGFFRNKAPERHWQLAAAPHASPESGQAASAAAAASRPGFPGAKPIIVAYQVASAREEIPSFR